MKHLDISPWISAEQHPVIQEGDKEIVLVLLDVGIPVLAYYNEDAKMWFIQQIVGAQMSYSPIDGITVQAWMYIPAPNTIINKNE